MCLMQWMNDKVKKYDAVDIGCIKLGSMAFILMAAKLWPAILGLEWYYYLIILAACAIRPYLKMFGK